MAAPEGNTFWKLRSKHGRKKLFETPELLWEAACEYFQWCDENPWLQKKAIQKTTPVPKTKGRGKNKTITVEKEQQIHQEVSPTARPYSLTGFCIYIGASSGYWTNFKAGLKNQKKEGDISETDEDFLSVITCVEETIETQQFEGAVVGAFNANIIARKLGLADKQDITSGGEKFGLPTTINIIEDNERKP